MQSWVRIGQPPAGGGSGYAVPGMLDGAELGGPDMGGMWSTVREQGGHVTQGA